MFGIFASALLLPAVLDSIVRVVLVFSHKIRAQAVNGLVPTRWLVLVPSRGEGARVEATLDSILVAASAASGATITIAVVLDGADAAAASASESRGAIVVTKQPPGPTKGAALRWAAIELRDQIASADAVLLLDVGSTVVPAFFADFHWSAGCEGAQAMLRGSGAGVGEAAAWSERFAQNVEDAGRQRLGWNVRLRGTGSVLTPAAFLRAAPRLRSKCEDFELSLILTADGARLELAPPAAAVADVKPSGVAAAAQQRARWLSGRILGAARHPDSFVAIARRNPAEAAAFAAEVLGRPLSLTIPLRCAIAALLIRGSSLEGVLASVLAGSAAVDVVLLMRSGAVRWRSAFLMALSWGGAVLLAPWALVRWMKPGRD